MALSSLSELFCINPFVGAFESLKRSLTQTLSLSIT